MRIEIDEDLCIGAGQCVMTAPEVFDQREEDGVAVVLEGTPAAGREGPARDAAAICPASAITIHDD